MDRGPSSVAPEGEEFPRTQVVVAREVWDEAGREVERHRRRRRQVLVVLVLLGAVAGAVVPTPERWPAVMVGTVAGGAIALWAASIGGRVRKPAKQAVAAALMSAGVPRVTVLDLARIVENRRVIVHHRQVESELGDDEVMVTVLDLSGRYWGPRGWAYVLVNADADFTDGSA